ncbi:HNH endonuclease [Kribbella sindirgiensis]|uniref:HNH endonuclease n=1 Tax=Kribbella sindirgiensis TaxID=1124744 RepID=A0A4R0ICA1_9ACTN|nr:HNH endonuclease [Kribbella sindirgiensis]
MIDRMSECAVGEPSGEGDAGRARLSVVPEPPFRSAEESLAHLTFLRDRLRRDAEVAARFGLLGRYDVPDDPERGVGLFEAVAFQDTSGLNDSGWLDRQEAISRLEARLAAMKAEATAGYEASLHGASADLGHRHPEPGDRAAAPGERRWVAGDLRSPADELALVWQMHKGAAMARIHTSCELVHNFPATLRALEEGQLTERAAFTIVRELSVLEDPEEMRAAETAVLEWAGKHPLQKIKQEAQHEAARRSPDARSKSHARAMDERSVRIFPNSDGTAELIHTQDALDAGAVMNSLTRAAANRRRHGDPRSMDQLRADIALARLLRRTDTRAPGESVDNADTSLSDDSVVGADATVVIHATGAEIRALIDGVNGTGGTAEHYGPIPQESLRKHLTRTLAQALLGGARRSRLGLRLSDEPPAGKPDRYTPDAATDRFVRQRDRTCQFPGCNQPAEFADVDHRIAFAEGGRTTTDNLHCLCRHHHRLKHEGGWVVTSNPDGSTTWASPTGRRYHTPPPDRGGSDPPDTGQAESG